jgi:hypothetical protein
MMKTEGIKSSLCRLPPSLPTGHLLATWPYKRSKDPIFVSLQCHTASTFASPCSKPLCTEQKSPPPLSTATSLFPPSSLPSKPRVRILGIPLCFPSSPARFHPQEQPLACSKASLVWQCSRKSTMVRSRPMVHCSVSSAHRFILWKQFRFLVKYSNLAPWPLGYL